MTFLHALALILLTLAGYSAGSALGARTKQVRPALGDLAVVVGLWVVAFSRLDDLGRWQGVLAALVMGIAVGALVSAVRPGTPDPRAHLDYHTETPLAPGFLSAWKRFAAAMGNFQGRMVMALFYFGVVTPFALLSRLTRDSSASTRAGTHWLERPPLDAGLQAARNQF